ncbi:Poly(3-hydroxyalkanoate) polymerase subunit PhaE [Caenorhabditis elegans]|uniref:Poly(3-hydroxyalkanoate) polymerase subunit PhaE n=1 Tax=Caenorhabditis elegans TaxID=6239 RepID=Q7JNR0_CAEEL|nr:Poly(3-hydroxyalkanoate) polymerase subunit PhaE [Caenorhabditis elegans]CCD61153.1 Poly(3-hydroxyalkanoate) polymerase subunit PhaE [Caenorhabditis elegans]|eukprot:NP_500724.2 Uncharacterized protein CELE_AC7.3 [Caenorhabditis elegans]
MRSVRDDMFPLQIVSNFVKESESYQKYRNQFKPAFKHFLTCVGLSEKDWYVNRPLRCETLFQQLSVLYTMTSQEDFLRIIRPHFEAAIAVENETHGKIKTSLQLIKNFYSNEFEEKLKELSDLAPELEKYQKNRSTDPEQNQQMDKIMNRFTELQRLLKSMIQEGTASIQSQHLKAMRYSIELYQKQNEQWSRSFASFANLKPDVTVKAKKTETPVEESKKNKKKIEKLSEGDKDL